MRDKGQKHDETVALVADVADTAGEVFTGAALEVFEEQVGPLLLALIGGTAAATAGATLPPIAGLVLGSAVKSGIGIWTRRGERWWKSFVAAYPGRSEKEREQLLREGVKSEDRRQAVFACVRSLLDALDDAVAEPLGRLAAEYHVDDKAPDWFFRGMARMLADLSADELVSMRIMLQQFAEHLVDGQEVMQVRTFEGASASNGPPTSRMVRWKRIRSRCLPQCLQRCDSFGC